VVAPRDVPGRAPLDFLEVGGELAGVGVPDGASELEYNDSCHRDGMTAIIIILFVITVVAGQPFFKWGKGGRKMGRGNNRDGMPSLTSYL
jgi:hypothetical protein